MKPIDYVKALVVAVAVLAITLAASFPMVAFYAYFIEPGHPQEFYNAAAQWIAPWTSYILGPLCFFAFNYWLARRSPARIWAHAALRRCRRLSKRWLIDAGAASCRLPAGLCCAEHARDGHLS